MAIVKGYVARYDIPGRNNLRFMKGCFDKNNGVTIPVVKEAWIPEYSDVIGEAKMFLRKDGLYSEAEVDLDKIDYLPKGIGFFGNHVEYGEDTSQVKNVLVRSISLLSTDDVKTSSIESIETDSQ